MVWGSGVWSGGEGGWPPLSVYIEHPTCNYLGITPLYEQALQRPKGLPASPWKNAPIKSHRCSITAGHQPINVLPEYPMFTKWSFFRTHLCVKKYKRVIVPVRLLTPVFKDHGSVSVNWRSWLISTTCSHDMDVFTSSVPTPGTRLLAPGLNRLLEQFWSISIQIFQQWHRLSH